MPGGNGTGSLGQGPVGGGRQGRGGRPGMGPSGNCVCPGCGAKVVHKAGMPCADMKCPECGSKMVREN